MLSELRAERKAHLSVVKGVWRLIWIVQPLEHVSIDEELLAQQGNEIGQAPTERAPQLKVLHQEHGNQSRPDLRLDGILGCAHKGLDLQSLLERLEQLTNILPINTAHLK